MIDHVGRPHFLKISLATVPHELCYRDCYFTSDTPLHRMSPRNCAEETTMDDTFITNVFVV